MILTGDCLEILPTLDAESVQCCVTSPPYWGLRDYGTAVWEGGDSACDHQGAPLCSSASTLAGYSSENIKLRTFTVPMGLVCSKCGATRIDRQIGLESTPEAYVEKLVAVFREVRRVLADDGTLWLNLGTSYAGLWGGHPTGPKPPTVVACDKNSNRSLLLQRVPACDTDDREFQGSQVAGRAYPDSCDERKAETQNHHGRSVHNGQSSSQGGPPTLQTDHDNERSDCGQEPLAVSLPDAQASTIEQSSCRPLDACDLEATALASQKLTAASCHDFQESERKTVCTSGTSQMLPPLVVRTVGKESFFSACGSPSCKGIGRCGLCWCNLTIPSLNVKPKDEINIPHLVAMALQADGWFLRQTIIWHKPNPMPESVTDRCTKSHEYIFLLTKSARYYYDAEAVKEDFADERMGNPGKYSAGLKSCVTPMGIHGKGVTGDGWNADGAASGRNRRSVWTVSTKPFKEAHFATFPPAIPEICIKAGSRPGDTILDPFSGAGTTGNVAERLGREYIGIELNPAYSEMGEKRIEAARLPLFQEAL